jgi:hypothetical protein
MEAGSLVGARTITHATYLEEDAAIHHYSATVEVRVPRANTYHFLPVDPDQQRDPAFEHYTGV